MLSSYSPLAVKTVTQHCPETIWQGLGLLGTTLLIIRVG